MENRYLFLLWNKALFKEKEIVEDINNSFNIDKIFYINWNKENYDTDLKSLYGHRLGSPIEKIIPCGKDKFLFILVEDKNPKGKVIHRRVFFFWNCGILVLTIGCAFQGVLDIYGTRNHLIIFYPIAGTVLLITGILMFFRCSFTKDVRLLE